jgi:5'-nucleotidase
MPVDFSKILVVGVSSRALFNLEEEEQIFRDKNIRGFREYQLANEDKLLEKGTAFPLVEALLKLNTHVDKKSPIVEVVGFEHKRLPYCNFSQVFQPTKSA